MRNSEMLNDYNSEIMFTDEMSAKLQTDIPEMPRLSFTNDYLPEEYKCNNDFFSPKPTEESLRRKTMHGIQSGAEESNENEEVEIHHSRHASNLQMENLDDVFDLDEMGGYTEEELFAYSIECFDIFSSINKALVYYKDHTQDTSPLLQAELSESSKQYTLVLDLDGTLVHGDVLEIDDYDDKFDIVDSYGKSTIYLRFRPYLFTFLEEMSKLYELIVFTAGKESYAKAIIDKIQQVNSNIKISHAFYRDACTKLSESDYYKDLTRLNRDMKKTLIIDNTPLVYSYNVSNAIPILSWTDDRADKELFILTGILKDLVRYDDITIALKNKYQIDNLINNKPFTFTH